MYLEAIADGWVNEPLEQYDQDSGQFIPSDFVARISLVDRFLSNFNRPLRRRMVHYNPNTALPDSLVVRVPASGAVLLIGQERIDSDSGFAYHAMSIAHLATDEGPNSSAGLAEVYRVTPDGPREDPGWATEKQAPSVWCDTEFRTSLNEADVVDERISAYFAFFSKRADVREHDIIRLHGREFTVTDAYPDSGILMARISEEPPYFVDIEVTYTREGRYDREQYKFIEDEEVTSKVTAILMSEHDYAAWSSDSTDTINLAINADNIGFEPKSGMKIHYRDRTRTIQQVSYYRGQRQYKLRCY